MLGLLSYALKQVIIELCQEKSSNHEKHGWNFYSQAVFLQPLVSRLIVYSISAFSVQEDTSVWSSS